MASTAVDASIERRSAGRGSAKIRRAVSAVLEEHPRVTLAVSGGVDSMTLLDAVAAERTDGIVVATFDHGTGPHATAACDLVEARAGALGVRCVRGRSAEVLKSEAQLREARWAFLRGVAESECAVIATAHTTSDQVETVFMRALRGAGARGLAGLYAPAEVVRPLISFVRSQIEAYAKVAQLAWIEDPSNASAVYLRNRVRLDVLPALRRVHPSIEAELLELSLRAAAWRQDVDAFVDEHINVRVYEAAKGRGHRGLDVDAAAIGEFDEVSAAVIWPAILARAGVVLDRRGTERLARFAGESRVGARIPLRAGWEVTRSRDWLELRASRAVAVAADATVRAIPLSNGTTWGDWSFHMIESADDERSASSNGRPDAWSAWLPADRPLSIRSWEAGDAMIATAGRPARKVKRLLSSAGVTGHQRQSWPVVLAGDQIVWVPGVHRGEAPTGRASQPRLPFRCDYFYRDVLGRPAVTGSKSPPSRLPKGRHR